MLFNSVATTLTEFAANPKWLGGTPSFTLVLLTWQQDLGQQFICMHWSGWRIIGSRHLANNRAAISISHIGLLSRVYRGKFIAALAQHYPHLAKDNTTLPAWKSLQAKPYQHDLRGLRPDLPQR